MVDFIDQIGNPIGKRKDPLRRCQLLGRISSVIIDDDNLMRSRLTLCAFDRPGDLLWPVIGCDHNGNKGHRCVFTAFLIVSAAYTIRNEPAESRANWIHGLSIFQVPR